MRSMRLGVLRRAHAGEKAQVRQTMTKPTAEQLRTIENHRLEIGFTEGQLEDFCTSARLPPIEDLTFSEAELLIWEIKGILQRRTATTKPTRSQLDTIEQLRLGIGYPEGLMEDYCTSIGLPPLEDLTYDDAERMIQELDTALQEMRDNGC